MERVGQEKMEKMKRPVRNKRYSRRTWGDDRRPPKRLFTPEIKRFLKDWLVRRRDNPYPNREEKKMLAVQTGLTYVQVCNWFANWRRKLKNAGKEPTRKTWGDLIKNYNNQIHGNVEHFSICSDDSIWEEPDDSDILEHSVLSSFKSIKNESQNQCYYVSSTTESELLENPFSQSSNKYKNHIMEKYLRDCQKPEYSNLEIHEENKPSMMSKWLESAANFKPSEDSYLDWSFNKSVKRKSGKKDVGKIKTLHGREELDAAEALTTLANSKATGFKV